VRDNLSAEFKSRYQSVVSELVDLFGRIGKVDREIDAVNAAAPDSESMRLRKVEAIARDVDSVQGEGSIIASVKLPQFAQFGRALAWPPMAATISMTQMMFPGNGSVSDADDPNYEVVCDEATGYFVSRRRADAPPLHMGPAPPRNESS
jgi:hypothetical protein